jgi:ABC-type multidrug transport system permease subunit
LSSSEPVRSAAGARTLGLSGARSQPPLIEAIAATLQLGIILFRRENPFRPAVLSYWLRAFCQTLLFTLLGVVAGGSAGGDFAFVGAVVLAGVDHTISAISDVPMRDRFDGTYPRLRAGRLAPVTTFALRSVPVVGAGCAQSVVVAVSVGLLTGRLGLAAAMLPALPLMLAAMLSAATMGLFVIAPAIGTRYDALTYNTVTVFVTLFTGAIIPRGTHGAFDALGIVLPLTNAMDGVRSLMSGGSWLASFEAELLIACGWGLVAAVTYALMDRRGQRTGHGAFEAS